MEKEIKDLTRDEMLHPEFVPTILEYCDTVDNKEEIILDRLKLLLKYFD